MTTVSTPTYSNTSPAHLNISYDSSIKYLEDAEANLRDSEASVRGFDDFTRIATGAGVGGAAVAVLFKGSNDLVKGLLTGAAGAYGANQLLDPGTQLSVLRAGVTNLQCIEYSADGAWNANKATGDLLVSLRRQIDTARQDIRNDITSIEGVKLQDAIDQVMPRAQARPRDATGLAKAAQQTKETIAAQADSGAKAAETKAAQTPKDAKAAQTAKDLRTKADQAAKDAKTAKARVAQATQDAKTAQAAQAEAAGYLADLKGESTSRDQNVATAEAATETATGAMEQIDGFLAGQSAAQNTIGEHVKQGVDQSLAAVNDQLRAKAPSLDAIAHSFVVLNGFTDSQNGIVAQLRSSGQSISLPNGAAHAKNGYRAGSPIADLLEREAKLRQDLQTLKVLLTRVPATVSFQNPALADQCHVQFAADTPVTVTPAGPLDLDAGGDAQSVNFAGGKAPYQLEWLSGKPTDVNVVSSDFPATSLSFSAQSGAAEHAYTFDVLDVQRRQSNVVTLNVHKAPAPQAPAPAAAPAGGLAAPPKGP